MDLKDAVSMTVILAGRSYPLKVHKSDEKAILDIVEEVNEKIKQFQKTYKNKDKQDCVTMTLLTYAVDLHKQKHLSSINPSLENKVDAINTLLDSILSFK